MPKNKNGLEVGQRLSFAELNLIKAKQREEARKPKIAPKAAAKKAKTDAAKS